MYAKILSSYTLINPLLNQENVL
uniref:Uncharacterized protein n=1 Tax=Rhizophora mucronata TaxID=61149 RepID=A0A2P2PGH8_RHIMU